ncbi:MAG TPA: DUF6265 family protein [Allosphingosinicella sp.]|nr:DUF6265 family protein [Allosphingosinicella sp.]
MGKALAAVLAMAASTGFSTTLPPAPDLRWLSGHWLHTGPEAAWAEEYWTRPRGDMMLGTGLAGKGREVKSFEYMRIQGVTFWGSPQGQAPVPFRLVERGPRSVSFENPKHDYPTRISYRRQGKTLIATITGPGGAKPQTWHYRRVRD